MQQELILAQLDSLQKDLMSGASAASYADMKVQDAQYKLEQKKANIASLQRQGAPLHAWYNEALKMYLLEGKADEVLAAYQKYRTKELKNELLFVYSKLIPFARNQIKMGYRALSEKLRATKEEVKKEKEGLADLKKVLKDYSKKISGVL